MGYSKQQIVDSISRWTKVLESMNEAEKADVEEKKTIKQKIKEGIEGIGSAASLAKSASVVASQVEPGMQLIRELIAAINRGAEAMEKLAASRSVK